MSFTSINSTNPSHEILAVIAQLLGVVEKLSFFESAILQKICKKKSFCFVSFLSKLVNIYGIARIFQNFDDYPGFQKFSGVPILLQHSVLLACSQLNNYICIVSSAFHCFVRKFYLI
jgi:hypothetical protein